ncbi:MAG: DUF5666 domain-containing protein [Caldisericota bacterium]|nr:DUF5666 domain-containing protein [Caldisericota bacterium]
MKKSDDKLKDILNDFKNGLKLNGNMEGRLLGMIEKKERSIHHRKFLLGLVSVAIAAFLVVSSVAPVFGKSGTLPQVIAGLSLERSANSFKGSLSTEGRIIEELENQDLSPVDSIIIVALLKESEVSVNEIIEMRNEKIGWGKILSELNISVNNIKNTMEQAQDVTSEEEGNGEGEENRKEKKRENQNQLKFVVIKGILNAIDGNTITVNETKILLTEETIIKCKGKSVNVEDLSIRNEVLVKASKMEDVFEAKSILVFTNLKESKGTEQETKEFELRSDIVSFDGNILTISDFEGGIFVDENTKIQKKGEGRTDPSVLVVGDTVQIHIRKSNDKYYVTSIVILAKPENGNNEEENNEANNTEKSNAKKERFKGEVSVINPEDGTLSIVDCDILFKVSEDTLIISNGRAELSDINEGDSVEIIGTKQEEGEPVSVEKITATKKNKQQENNHNESNGNSKDKGKP